MIFGQIKLFNKYDILENLVMIFFFLFAGYI